MHVALWIPPCLPSVYHRACLHVVRRCVCIWPLKAGLNPFTSQGIKIGYTYNIQLLVAAATYAVRRFRGFAAAIPATITSKTMLPAMTTHPAAWTAGKLPATRATSYPPTCTHAPLAQASVQWLCVCGGALQHGNTLCTFPRRNGEAKPGKDVQVVAMAALAARRQRGSVAAPLALHRRCWRLQQGGAHRPGPWPAQDP